MKRLLWAIGGAVLVSASWWVLQPQTVARAADEPVTAVGESGVVSGEAGLISLDFKDADVHQVLRVIALKSGVDIVAGPDVNAQVTIKLTNVPWERALDIILRTYGFTFERQGNIVRVMTVDALEQEALSTEVFPLDYADASKVPDIINDMLSDRGRVRFDARTNTIIVTDIPPSLFQIKEVLRRLDLPTPQVLIATRIVETKLEEDENLGIDWNDSLSVTQTASTFPSSFPFVADSTFGSVGDMFLASPVPKGAASSIMLGTLTGPAFTATLNMLKQRTDTKIVSNPTLAVLDNQEAKIHIGEEFPVPNFSVDPSTGNTTVSGFDTKTLGTVLTVKPHVNPNREVVVELKPEIVSFLANVSFAVTGAQSVSLPRFGTQTVETQVRVADGNTIAIGGLIKDTHIVQESKVPILGDIPLVGLLFKNVHRFGGGTSPTLKQDLLIFLTVTLLEQPKRATAHAAP
ncbi:MAG TPA: secretin N-terminal domain-containing protein [bacterium]